MIVEHILLIDDDKATTFYNKWVLKKHAKFDKIMVRFNGEEGIDYLQKAKDGVYPKPNIIFLDLNMPRMGGWDFIEKIKMFDKEWMSTIKIVILSTSKDPEDIKRAKQNFWIKDYISKPLSKGILDIILIKHFLKTSNEKSKNGVVG